MWRRLVSDDAEWAAFTASLTAPLPGGRLSRSPADAASTSGFDQLHAAMEGLP